MMKNRLYSRFAFLSLLLCLGIAHSPLFGGVSEDRWPETECDVVRGDSVELTTTAIIVFSDMSRQSYVELDFSEKEKLKENPVIDAPRGISAKVLSVTVSETEVVMSETRDETRTGTGYKIHCKIRVTPDVDAPSGLYDVKVTLPEADAVVRRAQLFGGGSGVRFTCHVRVWESTAEREAASSDATAAGRGVILKALAVVIGIVLVLCLLIAFGAWLLLRGPQRNLFDNLNNTDPR